MINLMNEVAAFHDMTDTPVSDTICIPPIDRLELRINLIREEVLEELIPAMEANDLLEIADAMADSIYVIVGAALEYGIPLHLVWDEVQRSNMAKVNPSTGKVSKRADGKILKPEGWEPPTKAIAKLLNLE